MAIDSPSQTCSRCDAPVPADARFCASCGQAMASPVPVDDATHARLSQSAPAPLVEKMRTARVTGERKPVTALFADVVGSTALAERMDPEDWTSMMNEAFDLMSKAVFRYEGRSRSSRATRCSRSSARRSRTRTTRSGPSWRRST